jgi:hypothetical protein
MALSRSDGFETDSVPAVNLPVQDSSYIGQPPSIVLGTHLGVDPNPNVTPGADKWTGWIGNKNNPATATHGVQRTTFTESFIVDFPAIADNIRNQIDYAADTSLTIAIPNNIIDMST